MEMFVLRMLHINELVDNFEIFEIVYHVKVLGNSFGIWSGLYENVTHVRFNNFKLRFNNCL
jgi:hypothetical protein